MNQPKIKKYVNKKRIITILLAILLVFPLVFASSNDVYKPYLHNPFVPKNPGLNLQGTYQTALWPGAATYNYPISVPPGTNGLVPSLSINYNHQSTTGRPSIVGAGFSLSENYIIRDVNYTFSNANDDKFKLIFNEQTYNLVYDTTDSRWHTEIESYLYIKNYSGAPNTNGMYWIVKTTDGTSYRFGYNSSSELVSNLYSYTVKWSLDLVNDTHNNKIYYNYSENPYTNDTSTVYLNKIEYNNDKNRTVEFVYDSSDRPDLYTVYEQGNKIRESRRLNEILIKVNSNLVRKYVINYNYIDSKSFIQSITLYGSDGVSSLPSVNFSYYQPMPGWYYDIVYLLPNPDSLKFEANGSDFGVRLVDLNRDGLVDIVKADGKNPTENQTWINNGSGFIRNDSWNIPYNIVDSTQNDTGLRFIDFNGDGFTDIVVGDGSTRYSWQNNGTGWILNSTWSLPTNANPIDSASKNYERGVRIEDLNGDNLPDILASSDLWNYAWINNGSGWTLDSSWQVPNDALFILYYQGKESGIRIFDINGDNLPDLIQGSSTSRRTWINNGSNWIEDTDLQIPSGMEFINSKGEDEGVRLADLNGDGLIDLTKRKADSERQTWINTGKGFVNNNTWNVPVDADFVSSEGKNKAVRLVDINGDGLVDLMNGEASIRVTYINSKAVKPYLLKEIKNNLGGSNIIDYGISTTIDNKGTDDISDMGFNLWVVGKVNEDNKINGSNNLSFNTFYQYQGGVYDYNKKEFRGFNKADEIKQNISIIRHLFYQNDSLKGKEYQIQIYDNNSKLFSQTDNTFNETKINNYFIINIIKTTSSLYDGIGGLPKSTEISFNYDNYGNPVIINYTGDNSTTGDEKSEVIGYVYNNGLWIVNKISNYSFYDYLGNKLRESYFRYDNLNYGDSPTKGDLTWSESWLNGGNNPVIKYGYDNYGNIVNETDPKGYLTQYVYGVRDTTNTFIDRIINSKNHIFDFNYDLGTGNLLWKTDANGIYINYTYDVFGRIVSEINPYDSLSYPTKLYNYSLDGIAPESIKISQREDSGLSNTTDMYYFYDGLGNLIQTKKESNNNTIQIVNDYYYDPLKRVIKISNPYFANFSENYSEPNLSINTIQYKYDALSRVIKLINQDGSSRNVSFEHWRVTEYDENQNKKIYFNDAYDQIIKVLEYADNNYFVTNYEYSPEGELLRINDSNKNELLNFSYDSLGRKIYQYNIDSGIWIYYYDNSSNLIKQTDSRGINISLTYDELNRVIKKNASSINLSFSYDNINGTLTNISGFNYTINYSYDNRLRKTNETTNIDGKTYKKSWSYDSSDRVKSEILPDGKLISYNYSSGGNLIQISDILTNVDYNVPDKPTRLIYSNALETNYSYELVRLRLNQIKTGNLQNLNYNYDSIGNLLGINDSVNGLIENMTYDKLDRLVYSKRGVGGSNYFKYNYTYNSLGGILNNSGSDNDIKFYYGNIPKHSPAKITSPYPLQTVPSTINFCKTINYGNRVYNLGRDIQTCGTCFNINAINVTFLGNSHIIKSNLSGSGFNSSNKDQLTIRNLTINNFNNGVYFFATKSTNYILKLYNIDTTNNERYGIFIYKTDGHIFENINSSFNKVRGIFLDEVNKVNLTDIYAEDNNEEGIRIESVEPGILLPRYHSINLINISTNRNGLTVATDGIYIKNSDNINITNIVSSNNYGNDDGIDLEGCINATITNVQTLGNNVGINLKTGSSNSIIKNGNVSKVSLNGNSINNTFLNVTYSDESVDIGSQLIRKWYLNTQVNYTNGTAAYQANVTGYNVTNNLQFSELTDSSGKITTQELIEYINNGSTKIYYSNYTINATKGNYYGEEKVNLTTNKDITIILNPAANYVNSCQTLNQSNSKYILSNNIYSNGTCFRITVDNITIDCNGLNITGNNSGAAVNATGIYEYETSPGFNFTVSKCFINNFTTSLIADGRNTPNAIGGSGGSILVIDSTIYNTISSVGGIAYYYSEDGGNGGNITIVNSNVSAINNYGGISGLCSGGGGKGGNSGSIHITNSNLTVINSYGALGSNGYYDGDNGCSGGSGGIITINNSKFISLNSYGGYGGNGHENGGSGGIGSNGSIIIIMNSIFNNITNYGGDGGSVTNLTGTDSGGNAGSGGEINILNSTWFLHIINYGGVGGSGAPEGSEGSGGNGGNINVIQSSINLTGNTFNLRGYGLNYINGKLTLNYSIYFNDTNAAYSDMRLKLINSSSGGGIIDFMDNIITGSGISNISKYIKIGNNSVNVNSSVFTSNFNKSANITLFDIGNRGFTPPVILRNGIYQCNLTTVPSCFNFTSLDSSTVIFNVSSWTNYSIGSPI